MEHHSEESVFNMALAYLQRIDKLLYMCQEGAITQSIPMWLNSLRAVFRELSVKLSTEEKDILMGTNSQLIDLKNKLDYDQFANFKNINYLFNNPVTQRSHRHIILYLLDQLDIKMRSKLQEKGMLLPSKDDPRFAVLKR